MEVEQKICPTLENQSVKIEALSADEEKQLLEQEQKKQLPAREIDKWNTPEEYIHMNKMIIKIVTDMLNEYKIQYFIDGGTLLGATRDCNMISYDDDTDVGIFEKDIDKLKLLEPRVTKMGMSVEGIHYPIKMIYEKGVTKIYVEKLHCLTEVGRRISTPGIDIFHWKIKGRKIVMCNKKFRQCYVNCEYRTSEMFPLKKYRFGELELMGPNNPFGYLERYYAKHCMAVNVIDLRDENGFKTDRLYFGWKDGKQLQLDEKGRFIPLNP